MAKVLYSPEARDDLDDIWVFLASNAGFDVAESFIDKLETACDKILLSPLAYRLRPEFSHDLRSFPFRSYVILYYPEEYGINVVRVLHAARDLDSIFE